MSYIGKEPQFTQYPSKFFNGDGTAMTVTLDYSPPNAAALLVFIDGVRQDTSAYTLSGTSLTFTGAVPSGTNNVQVVHLGIAQDTQVPVDDSVSTVKIQDDAVSTVKIQDDAVTSAKLDTNIAIDGNLTVDTDTLHVDSANNRVGIGTATPDRLFEVEEASGDAFIRFRASDTSGGADTVFENLVADNVQNNYIYFGDLDDTNIGMIRYNHANDFMSFTANASERMRIDSSGDVGIGTSNGTTTVTSGLAINNATAGNYPGLEIQTAGVTRMYFNANNAASYISSVGTNPMVFYTNGSERMRIDSSGNLKFNSGYGSTATAYGCRAWVNFNGTGTVAIRASGNVSSITDLGTGYYRVNFTTAMPNANYAVGGSAEGVQTYHMMTRSSGGTTTTSVRIRTGEPGGAYADVAIANVIIFR